jgi:hypothetical protein
MSESPKSKATGAVTELSVVLPAYNEEPNIDRVVRQVIALPRSHRHRLRDRAGERRQPRPHRRDPRRAGTGAAAGAAADPSAEPGYGAALRTGFDAAVKRYVFYMDGDGQFDINDLDKLLPLATEDAIVTGFASSGATRSSAA